MTYVDSERRYRLDSRIATGGMGVVWRGTDTVLNRVVAIKVLKTEYADDPTFRTRFETEARHAAALHHPGVAAVFDFGEGSDADGPRPFLVMELVEGQPLSNLLRPNAPMDPEVARELIARTADALGAAHAAGIVHRDVKPANLMVLPDRRVKITDFGIARAADGLALTATGQVMGTPQYLSPEQAEGGIATPASDIYSLGVVAFECLAGRRPFVGETPVTTALAHLREPVPDLPGFVPADLAAVVRRALAKKPAERFASAPEFAAALRNPGSLTPAPAPLAEAPTAVLGVVPAAGPSSTTQSTPAYPPAGDRARRRTVWPWLLLALVAVAAVAVLLVTQNQSDDDPTTPTDTPSSSTRPTRERSSPSTATSAPTVVTIDADDYIGRDVDEVAQELRDLDLEVSTERVDNPGDQTADTVENVSPDGDLQEGDTVTVTYWGAAPASEPSTPDTSTPTTPTTPTTPAAPTTPTTPAASASAATSPPTQSAVPASGTLSSPSGTATVPAGENGKVSTG